MAGNDPFANDPATPASAREPQEPQSGSNRKKVVISLALVAAGLIIGGAATGIAVALAKGISSSATNG